MSEVKELLVCLTGASGMVYADRLLRKVMSRVERVGLVLTPQGAEMAAHELGWAMDFDKLELTGPPAEVLEQARLYHPEDLSPLYGTGSPAPDAMVVIPCTSGAVARIAAGLGDTLMTRGAAVCLKNRKPLVLVVRDAPLSLIDLRNLTALAEAGATIIPASPAFYPPRKTIEELADRFVEEVLERLGLGEDDYES